MAFKASDINKPPAAAILISPSSTVATPPPTYTWNAATGSAWYYLWIQDTSGIAIKKWYSASQAGCAGGSGTCSIKLSTAVTGSSTWWVRTWNSSGYGPWSAPGKIRVGQSPKKAQCLNLPSSNKSFGSIGVSDWRNWVGNNDLAYAAENENLAVDASTDNRKSLRQKLAPASKGSTRSVARAGLTPGKTYRLTQSVYFEPGFDWGGKNEGGKLGFGLGGGSAPTGGLVRTDGFTLRFMWRGNKDGTAHIALYSYAADRGQKYGADYPLEGFDAPIGKWFELSMELTVNSATGVADGSVRAWADGVLRVERNNIAWQTSGGQPSVQDLFYTTFYGGNDTSWSPDHTTHVRFSDVCWAPVVDGYSGIDLDSGNP